MSIFTDGRTNRRTHTVIIVHASGRATRGKCHNHGPKTKPRYVPVLPSLYRPMNRLTSQPRQKVIYHREQMEITLQLLFRF